MKKTFMLAITFIMTASVLAAAELQSFWSIPWGASMSTATAILEQRDINFHSSGIPNAIMIEGDGTFADYDVEGAILLFKNDRLIHGFLSLDDATLRNYVDLVNKLTDKYGESYYETEAAVYVVDRRNYEYCLYNLYNPDFVDISDIFPDAENPVLIVAFDNIWSFSDDNIIRVSYYIPQGVPYANSMLAITYGTEDCLEQGEQIYLMNAGRYDDL